jgi:hypothetical protein
MKLKGIIKPHLFRERVLYSMEIVLTITEGHNVQTPGRKVAMSLVLLFSKHFTG